MARVALCFALLAFLGSSPMVTAQFERCEQGCPDDDDRGQCAPTCQDCSCCSHVRTQAAAPSHAEPAMALGSSTFETTVHFAGRLFVDDIRHVPKPTA